MRFVAAFAFMMAPMMVVATLALNGADFAQATDNPGDQPGSKSVEKLADKTAAPIRDAKTGDSEIRKAHITDLNGGTTLFHYEQTRKRSSGQELAHNTYTDSAGQTVVIEEAVTEGPKVISYKLEQKQLGQSGQLEVKGDQIEFSYTKDGKTKTAHEKVTDRLLIGPSLMAFLQKHWSEIQKGDKVEGRFAVLDRLETVGFRYFKVDSPDKNVIVVKMQPSSMLIAAIVDPLFFTFSSDGQKLIQFKGRTLVKQQREGKYKDFDGVTIYE